MTFREWYFKKWAPKWEGHAVEDYDIAQHAWIAGQESLLQSLESTDTERMKVLRGHIKRCFNFPKGGEEGEDDDVVYR